MRSFAFKNFVDDKFVSKFQNYLESYFDINDIDAEEELIPVMCRYYADKISTLFNFEDVKSNYIKNLSNLSPDLDYTQARKAINVEQSKLETFARLQYCLEDISVGYYDMECLVHLFLIYVKLNKKSVKEIESSKVYQYLYYAFIKRENIDLKQSIAQHAIALQNAMTSLDYDNDYTIFYSHLDNDGTLKLPDKYETKLTKDEIEKYQEIKGEEKALFVVEKLFKERLIAEMHTLDNGKVF